MADTNALHAGLTTTRLDADEVTLRERRRKMAAARGNLAALMCSRYGVDPTVNPAPSVASLAAAEFAELADILGLDPTPHPRGGGLCRKCRQPIPLSAVSRNVGGGPSKGYKTGMCWWCSQGLQRPEDAKPAVVRRADDQPALSAAGSSYRGGTGHCTGCGREHHLTGEGRLRRHLGWENRAGVQVRLRFECPGSGELSREHADLAHLAEVMPS